LYAQDVGVDVRHAGVALHQMGAAALLSKLDPYVCLL
jgi:hypothetical protein